MRSIIKRMAEPVFERVGTVFATFLVAQGVPETTAEQAATAAAIVVAVMVDVIFYQARKRS